MDVEFIVSCKKDGKHFLYKHSVSFKYSNTVSQHLPVDVHHTYSLAFLMKDYRTNYWKSWWEIFIRYASLRQVEVLSKFSLEGSRLQSRSKVNPGKICSCHDWARFFSAERQKNHPRCPIHNIHCVPIKTLRSLCNCCTQLPTDCLRKWSSVKDGFNGERCETSAIVIETCVQWNADGQMASTPEGARLLKKGELWIVTADVHAPQWTFGWTEPPQNTRAEGGNGSASKSLLSPCLSRKPGGILGKERQRHFWIKKKKGKKERKPDLPR